MNQEKLIKYLDFARTHYKNLALQMKLQNQETYRQQHLGKAKFIDLLIIEINQGEFD